MIDLVLVSVLLLFGFSFAVFYWFAMFTRKLIKQHHDIYPLLYEIEEAEKKKKDQ